MQMCVAIIVCLLAWASQPERRFAASLAPGGEVNRTLHPAATFSREGKLIEGVLVLNEWQARGSPSMSADIRWNGVESLAGGLIIMERWPSFQLCQLLEPRRGERVRCIVVHRCRGEDVGLVVAGMDGREIHRAATEWFAGSDDTENVGAVTVYFEMSAEEIGAL